ncbi:hypothetical protein ES708_20375 [subsurface metagenome]
MFALINLVLVILFQIAFRVYGGIQSFVGHYLNSSGMVAGKRCFAFVTKNVFGAAKALSRLMKGMEKEGMFLKYSAILNSPLEAEEIGKHLHIK